MAFKGMTDIHSQFIRMKCDLLIEIICEKYFILNTKQSAFCQHGAMLFDEIAEVFFQSWICDNDCLTEHGAYLCATDVKDISKCGKVGKHNVISLSHQTISAARTVNEQV